MTVEVHACAALEVTALSVQRGGDQVLGDLTLQVAPGSLTVILGANGTGKSTLLLAIAGVIRADHGRIAAFGQALDGLSPDRRLRRGVVLVPQGRHLFAELTAREHLQLLRRGRRLPRDATAAAALQRELERFPQLRSLADTPVGLLSGGQQQLVAVLRGLAAEPRLLLLDEPTAALAAGARDAVLQDLRGLADAGAAVVVVEQEVGPALEVADRALTMAGGGVAGDASGQALAALRTALLLQA